MIWRVLTQYEWLLIELLVLGLAVNELVRLRRDKRRSQRDTPPAETLPADTPE